MEKYSKTQKLRPATEAEYDAFLKSLPKGRYKGGLSTIGEPPIYTVWDEVSRAKDHEDAINAYYDVAKRKCYGGFSIDGKPHADEFFIWDEPVSPEEFFASRTFTKPTRDKGLKQKFEKGDRVVIAEDYATGMWGWGEDAKPILSPHCGKHATVYGSYADMFGGSMTDSYSLEIDDYGRVSWFDERALTREKVSA
jgi:hypothetical protein